MLKGLKRWTQEAMIGFEFRAFHFSKCSMLGHTPNQVDKMRQVRWLGELLHVFLLQTLIILLILCDLVGICPVQMWLIGWSRFILSILLLPLLCQFLLLILLLYSCSFGVCYICSCSFWACYIFNCSLWSLWFSFICRNNCFWLVILLLGLVLQGLYWVEFW